MDRALLARVERQAWFHRFPRGLPMALLFIGLAITTLIVVLLERNEREASSLALQAEAVEVGAQIEGLAGENTAYLSAAASLFSLIDEVSRDDLASFVGDMSENHNKRGILGVGWARWTKGRNAHALEAQSRLRTDLPAFTVHPAPPTPDTDMAIIALLEPETPQNRVALGYDMYSERSRRAAMDRARATRMAIASERITLLQDGPDSNVSGTLLYMPVFERDAVTGKRGHTTLKGFVYSPIRINEILRVSLAGTRHKLAHATLHDVTSGQNVLLATYGRKTAFMQQASHVVEFAGRRWRVTVLSGRTGGLILASQLVLGFGVLTTLLVSALALFLTHRAAEDRKVLEMLSRQTAIRNSLTRELHHRVKNTLANVLSIVALTRRRSTDIDEFAAGLTDRIRALSATHDLLSEREWSDAPLAKLVESELAPYLDPDDPHVVFGGPDVTLAPSDALSLGLAIHELATNAAKYGALSTPEGRVAIHWDEPLDNRCILTWRESGGPAVTQPEKRGFGVELVERIVSREIDAPITVSFEPGGVVCTIPVPVRTVGDFALRRAPK